MGTFSSLIDEADDIQTGISIAQANGEPDPDYIQELAARRAKVLDRAARSAHARTGATGLTSTTIVDHKGRHWQVLANGNTPTVVQVPAPPSPISGDQVQAVA